MTYATSKEVHLRRRPVGMPDLDDFEVVEVPLGAPDDGQVRVANRFMSVDPYMRGRMIDRKSYVPPFEVGAVLQGGAVGEVLESKHPDFAVGDEVLSMHGWREQFLSDGRGLRTIRSGPAPLETHLGVMGMPGMTAYIGLLDIGRPESGETVFVSGAAGAVGSAVCQIAKLKGCRVVGSAGSADKVDWLLEEAGADAAFNYKTVGSLGRALREHCPDGVDIYFDNVGGDHLEAALWGMNDFGRIIACGSISTYNATEPPSGPGNLFQVVTKRLLMKGFIVSDHPERYPDFVKDMASWVADGSVRWRQTVVEGIERAPEAFLGLFTGENVGKMLVRLG